jgi:hypothetical protein
MHKLTPKTLGWQKALKEASVPELKDILRMIQTRHVEGKQLCEELRNRNENMDLAGVLQEVCGRFNECREFVERVLMDESEDEMTLAKKLLFDESDGVAETPKERVMIGKRKSESDSHPSRQGAKKIKRTTINDTDYIQHTTKNAKRKDKGPDLRDGSKKLNMTDLDQLPVSFSHSSSKTTAPSPSFPTPPPKKKTIADIFAADAKRREQEAQEEEMKKAYQEYGGIYLDPWMGRCARCSDFYDKRTNNQNSCVFHSGKRRLQTLMGWLLANRQIGVEREYDNYQILDYDSKFNCCERSVDAEGCMESKTYRRQNPW